MNCKPIVPAFIPSSLEEVISYSEKLDFSQELQLDLVDGQFVDTVSWPYKPLGDPMAVKSRLDIYTLEVDLMVSDPISAAKDWLRAGADMLVFHVETLSVEEFKNFSDETNISMGVSAHGETSLDTLSEYSKYADYIQLMGIREIGSAGFAVR